MHDQWRDLSFYLPNGLSDVQVRDELRLRVRTVATDSGEFARRVRIKSSEKYPAGWTRWCVSYLPGPPGLRVLRAMRD